MPQYCTLITHDGASLYEAQGLRILEQGGGAPAVHKLYALKYGDNNVHPGLISMMCAQH